MKTNKLTLHPKDYIVLSFGLKIENIGGQVLTFELPDVVHSEPPKVEIKKIKLEEEE